MNAHQKIIRGTSWPDFTLGQLILGETVDYVPEPPKLSDYQKATMDETRKIFIAFLETMNKGELFNIGAVQKKSKLSQKVAYRYLDEFTESGQLERIVVNARGHCAWRKK